MKLRSAIELLEKAGVDSPDTDAFILAEHFCGISKSSAKFSLEKDITDRGFLDAVARRSKREPLQYILGRWYFMNEEYLVSPDCLIPRPETELLTEKVIKLLPENGVLLDLCCGSGCIAISSLAARKDCRAIAIDLFPATIDIAKKNAELNSVDDRIEFLKSDVTDANAQKPTEKFDVIVSNPPYIRTDALETLEPELFHEPAAALDGGEDGLIFYRSIISDWSKLLKDDGTILFEIGYDQGEDLLSIANENNMTCKIIKDFSGLDRIALVKRKVI